MDLQGAVAAVQVVQTRRVDELLEHASQRLQTDNGLLFQELNTSLSN